MKKPEEYIKYGVEGYSIRDIIDNITDNEIIEMMEEMQRDAYNLALIDAVKNVRITVKDVYISRIGGGDWESAPVLDESSILNLKIDEKNISENSCQ